MLAKSEDKRDLHYQKCVLGILIMENVDIGTHLFQSFIIFYLIELTANSIIVK